MSFEIYPTTAENIVSCTDAVTLKSGGCDIDFISDFLDITKSSAEMALMMAKELGLLDYNITNNLYLTCSVFSKYLVSNSDVQKSSILRIMMLEYEPFKFFISRLYVTSSVQAASEQTKSYFAMSAHRNEIKDTFISLGTYSQLIVSEGAGLYKVNSQFENLSGAVLNLSRINIERLNVEMWLEKKISYDVYHILNKEEVIKPLVLAVQKLIDEDSDYRAIMLHIGNAFESFLTDYANLNGVNVSSSTGVNAKIDALSRASKITTKHKHMSKYIGHIRNAADHGVDSEIGQVWDITRESAEEAVSVVTSCIRNIVKSGSSQYWI